MFVFGNVYEIKHGNVQNWKKNNKAQLVDINIDNGNSLTDNLWSFHCKPSWYNYHTSLQYGSSTVIRVHYWTAWLWSWLQGHWRWWDCFVYQFPQILLLWRKKQKETRWLGVTSFFCNERVHSHIVAISLHWLCRSVLSYNVSYNITLKLRQLCIVFSEGSIWIQDINWKYGT